MLCHSYTYCLSLFEYTEQRNGLKSSSTVETRIHQTEFSCRDEILPHLFGKKSYDACKRGIVPLTVNYFGLFEACRVTFAHCGYGIFSDFFFCLHFSEHAQWGLPVMSDILVKIFLDISCNICGLFLL